MPNVGISFAEWCQLTNPPDDAVIPFAAWCRFSGISVSAGRRLVARGGGPEIVRNSAGHIGVKVGTARRWQDERKQSRKQ
jgi:hypothetical protein